MAAGESFFLDEFQRFGDCWHGIWRQSTLKITTPSGPVVDTPGQAPQPAPWGTHGECNALIIPGLPVPTNTAQDTAAGATWLNYALLSGHYRRLYGKPVSAIYLDPANKPWKIDLTPNPSLSGLTGTAGITVGLRNFGDMTGSAVVTQTSAELTAAFTINSDPYGSTWMWIEDLRTDGRGILMHIACGHSNLPRRTMAVFELTIAGTPPSATFTWTKLADEASSSTTAVNRSVEFKSAVRMHDLLDGSNYGPWYWVYTTNMGYPSAPVGSPTGYPWVVSSQTYTSTQITLLGARYSAGNAAEVIVFEMAESMSSGGDIVGDAPESDTFSASGNASYSCTWSIKGGSTAIFTKAQSMSATRTARGTYQGSMTEDVSGSTTIDGTTTSMSVTNVGWGTVWVDYMTWPYAGITPAAHYSSAYGHRYSNAVYGPVWVAGGSTKFGGIAGKIGSDATTKSAANYAAGPRYASEHPVTGQLVWDTTPVCWV